jgi:NADH:ubiquinone oxidoreductase subunit K
VSPNVWIEHYRLISTASGVLFTAGLYCIFASHNLIRVLVGIEMLTKSVTLMLALAGALTGRMATAEAFIITLIVMEVVAIAVATGLVVGIFKHHGSARVKHVKALKG